VSRLNRNICCIFGHRTINKTENLRTQLSVAIESLIVDKNVDTFLFGSKSQFNDLCYELVSRAKKKYPHIKRIYVRAEFPNIDDSYRAYLLERYEGTVFPNQLLHAGRSVYVRRNFEMINQSWYCLVYFDKDRVSATQKSGTQIALDYAIKQKKEIVLCSI